MLIEEPKRTVSIYPITLLFYFVFLIGMSVSATYWIMHHKLSNQLRDKNQELLTDQKNNKALADKNIELLNSLQKLDNEYSKLEPQYKGLASRLDSAEQKNMQKASELAEVSKDLETAKAQVITLTGELEALNKKYNDLKVMLAPHLVLGPTWVSSGKRTMVLDGNLAVVLHEASGNDNCPKDSAAFSYLISSTDKRRLCLRAGKPEGFKYQGKKYLFNLLESKRSEEAYNYCVSIIKAW